MSTKKANAQKKKRKHRDFDTTSPASSSNNQSPKKRQKRSSKKVSLIEPSAPNSHVTVTFANINGTIDAIILPKQNVIAITDDVLLENKGKLSIKTSDPIQNEITPQIPIDIKVLKIPNVKTIHPRNSFRMGTSLFYCMVCSNIQILSHTQHKFTYTQSTIHKDEERLFWSFPLRNTRRVSCQHYCCAVNKIVTRSVGIHSNKCNGNHSVPTPCIYSVCNGKPPKGIIPNKLLSNYQYFQHSAKTDLLVSKQPNDERFKKVPNTLDRSTMYSNVEIISNPTQCARGPPPPLVPMNGSIKIEPVKPPIPIVKTEKKLKNNSTSHPFVQNVQIDLKALSAKQDKLKNDISARTNSTDFEQECGDYSSLLLHSTSSVIRDTHNKNMKKCKKESKDKKKYINLLLDGCFDEVIESLKVRIGQNENSESELNEYRLLMATALFYRDKVENSHNDCLEALHFCNLILSECDKTNFEYYESRKIRGLIHKKMKNYKAACHDFEYICFENPYHQTWTDKLYSSQGKSNCYFMKSPLSNLNNLSLSHSLQAFGPSNSMQPAMDSLDISNPNAPIKFIPSIVSRKNKKQKTETLTVGMEPSLLDTTYSDLQQIQPPKEFPPRSSSTSSNGSFDGLLALAQAASSEFDKKQKTEKVKKDDEILHGLNDYPPVLSRKSTMEELLGTLKSNVGPTDPLNGTPEPMERIRSDALA